MSVKELKIFCGNANRALAEEIVDYLGVPLGEAKVKRFKDGEITIAIDESVRGRMSLWFSPPVIRPMIISWNS